MPEPTGRGSREFLPSANQALSELEETTGKPVMIVDAPELNVLATIRQAGPQDSSHLLRIKGGSNRVADYLIVFQCHMALRDGHGARAGLRSQLPQAKARELGAFLYDGLILQLRSMGPGLLVDRWIRQHCLDLQEVQEQAIESEITNNLGALKPGTRAIFLRNTHGHQ